MKIKKFYEPIFAVDVVFITDTTPNELEGWFKKNKYNIDKEDYKHYNGLTMLVETESKNGGCYGEYVIVVENKKDFYVLMHECYHLAMHIMNDRGIPIRKENDEIGAYLQTHWFKTLWRFMNKKKR